MPEEEFDGIVHLARQLCDVPVALVSSGMAHRQRFKARLGSALSETDLDSSVCAHALTEPDLLVIGNLTRDPRIRSGQVIGVLKLQTGRPEAFGKEDLQVVRCSWTRP